MKLEIVKINDQFDDGAEEFILTTNYYLYNMADTIHDSIVVAINDMIQTIKSNHDDFSAKGVSDGYHTFHDLYEFRKMYNALLFNEWGKNYDPDISGINKEFVNYKKVGSHYNVHKSWKHHDGEYCFGEEKKWFIVVAMLPTGQVTNHYKAADWDLFKVPEVEKALFPFDGHTSYDVLERFKQLITTETSPHGFKPLK